MTPALSVEATAERPAERPAGRSPAGPRPDDRQTQLICLVRERDAAGTTRQLQSWVHRRGLESLRAFRQTAVPDLLSAADDAWLEGCLHPPLERRLALEAPALAAIATADMDPLAWLDQGAAAGPEQPISSETSPTGLGLIRTQGDGLLQSAGAEAPLPFPSSEQLVSAGVASGDGAGPQPQELVGPWPGATFNTNLNAEITAHQITPRTNPQINITSVSVIPEMDFSKGMEESSGGAIAAAANEPAAGAVAGTGLEDQAQITSATQAAPSQQPQGQERGLSAAGAVLADAPQRLRRKLVGSFGKARMLMRACFEEAISTLHPHGEADLDGEEPLPSAASLTSQPTSQPTATSAPIGADAGWLASTGEDPNGAEGTGAAPMAAWSRSLASSLPAASLDVPLQGPPAPAPAHLADLRAWLPGSSGQDRRAS